VGVADSGDLEADLPALFLALAQNFTPNLVDSGIDHSSAKDITRRPSARLFP